MLADKLRAVRPETKVLFISGYSEERIGYGSELDGDLAYLSKPFTSRLLAERVREVLEDTPAPESGAGIKPERSADNAKCANRASTSRAGAVLPREGLNSCGRRYSRRCTAPGSASRHQLRRRQPSAGANPPFVLRRWIKVVLLSDLPPVGPCSEPLACSRRQVIASGIRATGFATGWNAFYRLRPNLAAIERTLPGCISKWQRFRSEPWDSCWG